MGIFPQLSVEFSIREWMRRNKVDYLFTFIYHNNYNKNIICWLKIESKEININLYNQTVLYLLFVFTFEQAGSKIKQINF